MAKLFVAVDLPADTREMLGTIVPAGQAGLRVVASEELHLTLHYIGEGEADEYAPALSDVRAAVFGLCLGPLGSFSHHSGQRTLWMGVQPSDELSRLHFRAGEALATKGFIPDARDFTPHITLARAGGAFPQGDFDRLLARTFAPWPMARITEFSLYSSQRVDDRPHYHRERTFHLG